MVEQIDKRILKENINPRELKPYFQKVQKTKKTNISCKLQNKEKELLEEFFKSNGKTNQEGYEEILLNYIDSLCFEQKYFQFEYCFLIEDSKGIQSPKQIQPLGFMNNYKNIEKNIESILPSNYGSKFKMSEIVNPKNNDSLNLFEDYSLDSFEIDEEKEYKPFDYMFIIQLNNLLDVKAKNGTYKSKKVDLRKNGSNKHRGLEIIMGSESNSLFLLDYDWELFETNDGYDVIINSFRVIPFNKLRIFLSTLKDKKVQEFLDKSLNAEINFNYIDEESMKEQIEMLENRIEFMNNQLNNLKFEYEKLHKKNQ